MVSYKNDQLIKLALQELGCSQKDLAERIDVSAAQVSKWKSGDPMSSEMDQKLRELIEVDYLPLDFVFATGGVAQSKQWAKLIDDTADIVSLEAETGYNTRLLLLEDDESAELLYSEVFYALIGLGVQIPIQFPEELVFDMEEPDTNDEASEALYERARQKYWDQQDTHPIAGCITAGFRNLNDLYGFFAAYIYDIGTMRADDEGIFEKIIELESALIAWALIKAGEESELEQTEFMPNYGEFRYKTKKDMIDLIETIKDYAIRHNIPLKAELTHLISHDSDDLREEAEFESLGFSSSRLHPDIYMNEILESIRLFREVLPAILKKLEIKKKDLDIDITKFNLNL